MNHSGLNHFVVYGKKDDEKVLIPQADRVHWNPNNSVSYDINFGVMIDFMQRTTP